jgi:uncharacterized membrane protein SpoIIM required for sporulation
MAESFIEKRQASWRRLEELLAQAQSRTGLRQLKRDEVRELGRSYRQAATDLAIARVEARDQRLVGYLNNLAIRAHGLIYRAERSGWRVVWSFYRDEFPALFRQTWRYTLAVALLFLLAAAFSFNATLRNDDAAEFAYLNAQTIHDLKAGRKWWEALNENAPQGTALILAKNTGKLLRAFASSILPVIGTLQALLPTALQFGTLNALAVKHGMKLALWSFLAGHSVLEFAAIFIACGAGLMLGMALLIPGERSRREALIEQGKLAVKLLAGCLPMLFAAALIEGFISPTAIHWVYKLSLALATAGGLAWYLSQGSGCD